ncbi:hypothetical protein I602_1554 [Polaribacter dokdonensis DSW-5]|uniref:Uncharacterized protein n=1 Tax=Polaribacter dokdonensis DSW-5 TaxID=1300348 RepID=A0A0N0UNM9_9FLAO|nr:hypothetical protein I602_1554 [Polaribacter dokdonensis DSW-5]
MTIAQHLALFIANLLIYKNPHKVSIYDLFANFSVKVAIT